MAGLAFALLGVDALIILEQLLTVHALRLIRKSVSHNAAPRLAALAIWVAPQDEARLSTRLHFLCRRFRPEALRWQFVVATRREAALWLEHPTARRCPA